MSNNGSSGFIWTKAISAASPHLYVHVSIVYLPKGPGKNWSFPLKKYYVKSLHNLPECDCEWIMYSLPIFILKVISVLRDLWKPHALCSVFLVKLTISNLHFVM